MPSLPTFYALSKLWYFSSDSGSLELNGWTMICIECKGSLFKYDLPAAPLMIQNFNVCCLYGNFPLRFLPLLPLTSSESTKTNLRFFFYTTFYEAGSKAHNKETTINNFLSQQQNVMMLGMRVKLALKWSESSYARNWWCILQIGSTLQGV